MSNLAVDLAGGSKFGVSLAPPTGNVSATQTGVSINLHSCHVRTHAMTAVVNHKADILAVPQESDDDATWSDVAGVETVLSYIDPLTTENPTDTPPEDQGPTVCIGQSFLRTKKYVRVQVQRTSAVNFRASSIIIGQPKKSGDGGGNDNYPSD